MGSQGGGQVMEIVGIVDDVRTQTLAATPRSSSIARCSSAAGRSCR